MPTALSLRLPHETGTRLHNLADMLGTTVTDAVGALLDHAARTGMGTLALPGIDIKAENGAVQMRLDDFAVEPFAGDDAQWIAEYIREVSKRGGARMNLDCPTGIKITRLGRAVVIEAQGVNGWILRKVITCGLAKSVADRLESAANELGANFEAAYADRQNGGVLK